MEQWDQDYVDMEHLGFFEFTKDMQGGFAFGLVKGWCDCRIEACGSEKRIEFSWEGKDENDVVSGRGWAVLRDEKLEGRIYIHNSDDSWFVAEKLK